jgi:hypothetical protein
LSLAGMSSGRIGRVSHTSVVTQTCLMLLSPPPTRTLPDGSMVTVA